MGSFSKSELAVHLTMMLCNSAAWLWQTSFAAAVAEAGTVVARRAMVLALERAAVVDTSFRAHPVV